MKQHPTIVLSLILLCTVALFLTIVHLTAVPSVRGKTAARPLTGQLTTQQQHAQEIALSDGRVQAHTLGRRSEVMGVRELRQPAGANSAACAAADCRRVDIYSLDTNATTSVIVNLDNGEILDVWYQPGLQPGLNARLADRAVEIALTDPAVIAELGFRPTAVDMAPVAARLRGTSCDEGHLCAGPTFRVGNRILWAVVDLNEDRLAGLDWTDVQPDGPNQFYQPASDFCPTPGSVNRGGWTLDYATTDTDGLHVSNASYQGRAVLTSAKLVEWHVDYNGTYFYPGFFDITGCTNNTGNGFPIAPYGETQLLDLVEGSTIVGFELVQDFRMSNWGAACNYRYEQRMQFWDDGRFRIVSGAFGRGCGDSADLPQPVYRPVVRIDIAVNGDDNDTFAWWDGGQWQTAVTETYRTPYADPGHGPHAYDAQGAAAWVMDSSGLGYYVIPGQGQFGDGGRGDAPFLYVTRHKPEEGDADLPIINPGGSHTADDYQQGPDLFVNGESTDNTNIVLWYVPQHGTDRLSSDGNPPYCWTVAGEPNPETYPCYGGPLFVPFGEGVTGGPSASFAVNGSEFGVVDTAVFTSTSTLPDPAIPANFIWDFGDGVTTGSPFTATHRYLLGGVFTPTLTVDAFVWGMDTAVGQPITATAKNNFLPLIENGE